MNKQIIIFCSDETDYIEIEVERCENAPYDFMDHLDQWMDAQETQQSFKELMDSFIEDGCISSHRILDNVFYYHNYQMFDMDDYTNKP